MALQPTKLELSGGGRLRIVWNDGHTREYTFRQLRDACPCATCREQRKTEPASPMLLPVLKPQDLVPLAIRGMRPVGHYAYQIEFSDGHETGIYTLELLRELGYDVVDPQSP